jgi:hypothetical protein
LNLDRHCDGFLYDLTNRIELSGTATSGSHTGLLYIICVIDDEDLSFRALAVRSRAGRRFSGFVSCDSGEKVRLLTVYAVDQSGCVSPATSLKGIVQGSDPSDADFLNDGDSVPILGRKTESRSVEVIEWGHNRSPSVLDALEFYCLSRYDGGLFYTGNFDFAGTGGNSGYSCLYSVPSSGDFWATMTYDGFATRMRIDDELSDSPRSAALLMFGGVTLNTSLVWLAGGAWLVRFRLTNGAESTKVVDLECDAELNGGVSYSAVRDFDRVGVVCNDGGFFWTCLCRSCPLVRDVSTYWIGSYADLSNNTNYWTQSYIEGYGRALSSRPDLGAAFSWQGLSLAPGESTTVGVVFQAGLFRDKPVLTLSYESNGLIIDGAGLCSLDVIDPLMPIRLSGTISNAGKCNLYVVIDSDLSKLVLLGSNIVTSFDINCSLTDLVGLGTHRLLFCAVDQASGRISYPTPDPTRSSSPRPTLSTTPTPSRSSSPTETSSETPRPTESAIASRSSSPSPTPSTTPTPSRSCSPTDTASRTPSSIVRRSGYSMIPGTVLEFGDRGLSVVDAPAARDGQSSEVKTVWISLAAVLAVALLIAAGIVLVVAHRRRASLSPTNRTESDGGEAPVHIESSVADLGSRTFLSEENALEAPERSLLQRPE